jgi:hypothetical protein
LVHPSIPRWLTGNVQGMKVVFTGWLAFVVIGLAAMILVVALGR